MGKYAGDKYCAGKYGEHYGNFHCKQMSTQSYRVLRNDT